METWSQEAEESILGAMMLAKRASLDATAAGLRAGDFYRPTNGMLYGMLESDRGADPLTALILIDKLEKDGVLPPDDIQRATIRAMPGQACPIAHVGRHAEIVKGHAALRRLSRAGLEIQSIAQSDGEIGPKLSAAEDVITECVQATAGGEMVQLYAGLRPALVEMKKRQPIKYISTGFRKLDDILVGLRPGKLVIVAARPGQGKTTLAVNILQHAAGLGVPTALFSLEMGTEEIGKKMMAAASGVLYRNLVDLRTPLSVADLKKMSDARSKLETLPIYVDDHSGTTMADVRAKARALKRTKNLGLIVVDYLQLMIEGDTDNRNNEVGVITRGMKILARELEVPIILVSQLSRASEKRQEKRPMLSDLRDSGNIEQDADQVVFIHRPEVYDGPNSDKAGVAELIVAKNRDGEIGFVNLTFVGRKSRFLEVAAVPGVDSEDEIATFGVGGD